MPRRRGKQIEVFVSIGDLKYGFRTTEVIHNAYKPELGQTAYNNTAGVFFGANSPKPPKASKDFPDGRISSYCSTNKISRLRRAGWAVTNTAKIRGVKTSGKTRTVYLPMPGGWNYAWNITAAEADLGTDLGFSLAQATDANNLVWGVDFPKPPRASKTDSERKRTSTFIQPKQSIIDGAIGKGYSISSIDYDLLPET